MENARTAAERIRPILRAMEQSIDTARRRRTHEPEPTKRDTFVAEQTPAATRPAQQPTHVPSTSPMVTPSSPSTFGSLESEHASDQPQRQKARAKRPNPFVSNFAQTIHSQAS